MSDSKWFTVYWKDGTKSHIFGPDVETAYTYAGIDVNLVTSIDWIDGNGITSTHWYNTQQKSWVPFKEITIVKEDFDKFTFDDLINLTHTHNVINVEFQNKDRVTLRHYWGCFLLNEIGLAWVEYIEIYFGEFFEGKYDGYFDDEEPGDDDNHYILGCNCQYFAPVDLPHAIEAFANRVKTDPFISGDSKYAASIEEIHSKQKISYVAV